jgi:hypothetical protein
MEDLWEIYKLSIYILNLYEYPFCDNLIILYNNLLFKSQNLYVTIFVSYEVVKCLK